MHNFFKNKIGHPSIKLEACSVCQLKCKTCYMNNDKSVGVGKGYLKYENFLRFINMNPFVKKIELSNNGEILLNPDLEKIMELAFNRKIILKAMNGVNFNTVSESLLEGLVKYRFKAISFSIDGASQAVYSGYRVNGDFNKVIANIKRLNYYKKKYNSPYPELFWQYIVMEKTEDEAEIKKAKELAGELKISLFFKKTWDKEFKPKDIAALEKITGLRYSTNTLYSNKNRGRWIPCFDLWLQPQINWDGSFLGCCCNYRKDFGLNAFEYGLSELLNSKIVRDTKKMLMGGPVVEESPCASCLLFKEMVEEKKLIKKSEFSLRLMNVISRKVLNLLPFPKYKV